MLSKKIEFNAHEDYFQLKQDFPTPIKLNIPEWFKKLNHSLDNFSIKGCMPFLDSLTTGYLLKMPQDFHIVHNVDNLNSEGKKFKDSFFTFGLKDYDNIIWNNSLNLNSKLDVHSIKQLEGSPLVEKNKNLPFYKILNPWKIKTPDGYSCLFTPPLNNSDDRFSIISGIVDTDTFNKEVNFPIVINGDKYPSLNTVIQKGTPYVQVIPFKRDSWKMELKPNSTKEIQSSKILTNLKLINFYKNFSWKKKTWN
jgi:hypothetical protein